MRDVRDTACIRLAPVELPLKDIGGRRVNAAGLMTGLSVSYLSPYPSAAHQPVDAIGAAVFTMLPQIGIDLPVTIDSSRL